MRRDKDEELPAIAATCQVLAWLVPVLDKMPRARKFTLGDRIEGALVDLCVLLPSAAQSRDKRELPRAAPC